MTKETQSDYCGRKMKKKLQQAIAQNTRLFRPKAQEIADEVCRRINAEVPVEVEGVKYARHATLEWVIQILQDRV